MTIRFLLVLEIWPGMLVDSYPKIVVLCWESAEIKWSIIQNNQIDPDDQSLIIVREISLQHFPIFFFHVHSKKYKLLRYFTEGCFFFSLTIILWTKQLSQVNKENRAWPLHLVVEQEENIKCIRKGSWMDYCYIMSPLQKQHKLLLLLFVDNIFWFFPNNRFNSLHN